VRTRACVFVYVGVCVYTLKSLVHARGACVSIRQRPKHQPPAPAGAKQSENNASTTYRPTLSCVECISQVARLRQSNTNRTQRLSDLSTFPEVRRYRDMPKKKSGGGVAAAFKDVKPVEGSDYELLFGTTVGHDVVVCTYTQAHACSHTHTHTHTHAHT